MNGTSEDARVVRTRALVQDAVRDLFEREGAGALTHQRVAERAGVSRATVYRHWPRPIDLVLEALGVADQPLLHAGEGQPLREWLRRELARAAADFARPVVQQFIATIVGNADRSELITALVATLTRRTVSAVREALDRAGAEGAVFQRRDEYQLIAELVGPVIVQVMMYRMPADEQWVARLVDSAIDDRCAAAPSAGRRRFSPSTVGHRAHLCLAGSCSRLVPGCSPFKPCPSKPDNNINIFC